MSFVGTVGPSTEDERSGLASRVELYECSLCGPSSSPTRFPRYNSVSRLLQASSRKGRCGEWANAFCCICLSLGYETRYVIDLTDHVWCEVWSARLDRWLCADSCEAKVDVPGLYERGWNKRLTHVFAFERDHVTDVTGRYSRNVKDKGGARDNAAEEIYLKEDIGRRNEALRRRGGGSDGAAAEAEHSARVAELARRSKKEMETMNRMQGTPWETTRDVGEGRISGEQEWKETRGEAGGGGGKGGGATVVEHLYHQHRQQQERRRVAVPAFVPIDTNSQPSLHSRITVDPNLLGPCLSLPRNLRSAHSSSSSSSFSSTSPSSAIVFNDTPCALGLSGLNVAIIDSSSYAILQTRCFSVYEGPETSGLRLFLESVPLRRIVCAATVSVSKPLSRPLVDFLRDVLDVSLNDEHESGFAFVTTQHHCSSDRSKKNVPSFHTVSGGRIDVVLPPLSSSSSSPQPAVKARAFKDVAPRLVGGRVPDSVMRLDRQLVCTPVEASAAAGKALEEASPSLGYIGFSHYPKQPIFLLTSSAYPLKRTEGWTTTLKLPRPLVPELLPAATSAAPVSLSNAAFFVNLLGPSLNLGCAAGAAGGGVLVQKTGVALAEKRLVAFYFSASWCGPCKGFTPHLSSFYQRHQSLCPSDLEIIFVSADRTEADFDAYRKDMPWPSLPFAERAKQQAMSRNFGVRGIPCLVVVDSVSGLVVSQNGREDVAQCGAGNTDATVAIWLSILPETSLDAFDIAQVAKAQAEEEQLLLADKLAESYLAVSPPSPPLSSSSTGDETSTMTVEEVKSALKARVKTLFAGFVKDGLDPNAAAARAIKEASSSETPISRPRLPPAVAHEQDSLPCRRCLCLDAAPREKTVPSPPYRFFRLTVTALRRGADCEATFLQIGAIKFYDDASGTASPIAVISVSNPEGNSPANEQPSNLLNSDPNSKFLDFHFPTNKKSVLVFEMSRPEVVSAYELWTANDCDERDPSAFTLEGSSDAAAGTAGWTMIDSRSDFECPASRLSQAGRVTINFGSVRNDSGVDAKTAAGVDADDDIVEYITFDDSVRLLSSSRALPLVKKLAIGTDKGMIRKILINGGEATHCGAGFDHLKLESFDIDDGEFITTISGVVSAATSRISRLEFATSTGRALATTEGRASSTRDRHFSLAVPVGFVFAGFFGLLVPLDSTIVSIGIVCVDCRLTTKEAPCPPTCSRRFLTQTAAATRKTALALALKFVDNAIKNPSNPKLRTAKLSNKTFDRDITQVPGSVEFLVHTVGFDSWFNEATGEMLLTLPLRSDLESMKKKLVSEIESTDDWQNKF